MPRWSTTQGPPNPWLLLRNPANSFLPSPSEFGRFIPISKPLSIYSSCQAEEAAKMKTAFLSPSFTRVDEIQADKQYMATTLLTERADDKMHYRIPPMALSTKTHLTRTGQFCALTLTLVQGWWGLLYLPVPELQQGQVGPAIGLRYFKTDKDLLSLVLNLEITSINYKYKLKFNPSLEPQHYLKNNEY